MDELQCHVRSLEAMGVDGEQYGVVLTPILLSRLPEQIRMEWAREGEGREGDLVWLLDFLRREIERRERSQTFDQPAATPPRRRPQRRPAPHLRYTSPPPPTQTSRPTESSNATSARDYIVCGTARSLRTIL
jgi:hypothetical protein